MRAEVRQVLSLLMVGIRCFTDRSPGQQVWVGFLTRHRTVVREKGGVPRSVAHLHATTAGQGTGLIVVEPDRIGRQTVPVVFQRLAVGQAEALLQ